MPRKKTIQPDPLSESFELEDGTFVEIRNETCKIIGRGLHKRDKFEETRLNTQVMVGEIENQVSK